jgi:putative phosphoesterase
MMRISALYDVHANLPALRAVLADVDASDLVLVGGDVVWGPWPQETMDILRGLGNVDFIMGNADRDVFDRVGGDWKVANDWCADRLDVDHLTFLASRPATLSFDGVLFCHGSPRSDTENITTRTSDERVREAFADVSESTVVFGHTHAQFERVVDRWRLVNPGSVGNPFGEPGAYWARFVDGEPELRFTSYDVDAAAEAVIASGWPHADMLAKQLREPGPASLAATLFEEAKGPGT